MKHGSCIMDHKSNLFWNSYITNHLMTGALGNSKFCFPWNSMFPSTSSWEALRFLGNKIHCSPRDQSLSVYCSPRDRSLSVYCSPRDRSLSVYCSPRNRSLSVYCSPRDQSLSVYCSPRDRSLSVYCSPRDRSLSVKYFRAKWGPLFHCLSNIFRNTQSWGLSLWYSQVLAGEYSVTWCVKIDRARSKYLMDYK